MLSSLSILNSLLLFFECGCVCQGRSVMAWIMSACTRGSSLWCGLCCRSSIHM
ncbi:hypothetical protein M6B38_172935 [Iris pallida]|uniref:Uncharacterized protein n=1 Tax=Iris pallida TaxID=29817 RepID=A0AAX6ETP9_IRIPA|nr:hypothetical protein M6B38_172935 [Iris pallida]